MKVDFHPEAAKEYIDACNWYENELTGLGQRFKASVLHQIKLITENTEAYPNKFSKYRESAIKDFPYVVVYRLSRKQNLIYITAVYHTSRNSSRKYRK